MQELHATDLPGHAHNMSTGAQTGLLERDFHTGTRHTQISFLHPPLGHNIMPIIISEGDHNNNTY